MYPIRLEYRLLISSSSAPIKMQNPLIQRPAIKSGKIKQNGNGTKVNQFLRNVKVGEGVGVAMVFMV